MLPAVAHRLLFLDEKAASFLFDKDCNVDFLLMAINPAIPKKATSAIIPLSVGILAMRGRGASTINLPLEPGLPLWSFWIIAAGGIGCALGGGFPKRRAVNQ